MKNARGLRWASTLALAVTLLSTGAARADGTADEADLQFRLAKEAFEKGQYTIALGHLFQSNRLAKNRNVTFNIASTYEAMKEYANAHRYYVDALDGEADAKKKADIESAIARLAPNVAVLQVETSPPGATVYIDRKDLGSRGTAPRPLALPAGTYRVIAEKEGYEGQTSAPVEVVLGKQVKVSLTLRRIVGTVHIETDKGKGATVRVDDEKGSPACTVPCDLQLTPGRHELYLTAEGSLATQKTVVVAEGKTQTVTATLAPLTGSALISTSERNALILIDGKPVGFTPAVVQGVAVGKRQLEIKLRGYATYTTSIEVAANTQATVPDIELIPAREVTAVSRSTETIDDAPSSVSIIDGRELAAFGYPTIAEAIRGARGISLSNDRVYASAAIRGIGQPNDYGNRLLVLSDGQSLNDNLLNSSYIGNDGRVDLYDVDRIEVVRGPGSLLYGTGAFSGLINLVTRPRDEESHVQAAAGMYSDAALHARGGFHYHFTPDAGVWASVSGAHSEGVDLPIARLAQGGNIPIVHKVDAFDSIGTAGRAYWKSLTAQWFYHQREQRVPVGAYATVFNGTSSEFTDRRYMAEVRFEPRLSEQWQILTRAHVNRYEYRGRYVFEDSENLENLTGTWFGGEARIVFNPVKWLRLTAGGEGQYHPEATLLGDTVQGDQTTPYLNEKTPYSFGAGYALIEGSPHPVVRFSAGARVDVYSTFGPIVVPRGALILKPGAGHVLKIMGGRAFRAPSIYEQTYNDGGNSQVPAVDETRGLSLGPESIVSGEVEYSYRFFRDWVGVVAAHGSYIEGIMTSVPDAPGSDLVRYANSQSPAMVVGGEAELRREWRRGFMFAATYGYQAARLLDPNLTNPQLANSPEHLASIKVVAPLVEELASLGLRVTVEAPRRITLQSDATTRPAVIADAAVSGFARSLGLRYTVGVYNLAGVRYETPVLPTFVANPMPQNGRTFLVDAVWTWP